MSAKKILLSLTAILFALICQAQPGFMPPVPPPPGGPQMGMPHHSESQPLLIISGKEASFDEFRKIKPDEIESFSVFHDSEFTQRYGEKGKNGVIIVRLKSDKPEMPERENRFTGNVDQLVVPTEPAHHFNPDIPRNLVPYSSLTKEPSFQGGDENTFLEWLGDKIVRPDNCTHSGRMLVSFVIQADGKVTNVKIERGVCEVLDALVLKVVSDSPDWEPGMVETLPVNVMYTMPIVFRYR